MRRYFIRGGRPLYGNVEAQGSKNSAVAVIMACIAVKGRVLLRRVPSISDVSDCISLIRCLGAEVERCGDGMLSIDCTELSHNGVPETLTSRLRASSYLMGAELSRFGSCRVPKLGGCALGARPIDLHLYAFSALGARSYGEGEDGSIGFPDGVGVGGKIVFPRITVGGTVNALLASVCATGETTLSNCAREPHICDLASFLSRCGAKIDGIGTSEMHVCGVEELHGCEFTLSGDMIEAGTYLIAGAASRGIVSVNGIKSVQLAALFEALGEMGAEVTVGRYGAAVNGRGPLRACHVQTEEYPGFPTDLHPPLAVMMSVASGESSMTEGIFSSARFKYLNGLMSMGMSASVEGDTVRIEGGGSLLSAEARATDLRGGAALVIAALCAEGVSVISGVEYIERGYSFLPEKLRALGADITVSDG